MKIARAITVLNFLLIVSGMANLVFASLAETRHAKTEPRISSALASGFFDSESATFVTAGKHEHLVARGCKRLGFVNPPVAGRPTRLGSIAVSASLEIRGRNAQLHALSIPTHHEVLRV